MGTAEDVGSEAWELLFELAQSLGDRLPAVAAEVRLSVPQCQLLRILEPKRPMPMGALARALHCDASNVTGIVDRLETKGLIERRAAKGDRRVRELALTQAGAEVRAELIRRLYEPPKPIARLSRNDQRALCTILRRALLGVRR